MPETNYVVLRQVTKLDNNGGEWRIEKSDVAAPHAEAAIRFACMNNEVHTGIYVAIPTRSWKPVTVTAEQTIVLKIEDATSPHRRGETGGLND